MTSVDGHSHGLAVPAAIDTDLKPRRRSALSVSLTFAWRAMLKIKHVPEQLGDVIGIPLVFTVIFTYLFGGALAGSPGEYLQFLLPGTLVMTVLLLTMYTGVALNTDVTTGVSDRFRSLPIWRPAPIVGALLGDVVRYVAAAGLVLGLGLILGYRPDGGPVGVLAGVALILVFSFGLSWIWTLVGFLARTPNSVLIGGVVVLFPLTMVSNVFVDPATVPGWLQAFIDVNPVTHLVTGVRDLTAGATPGIEVVWVLATAAVLTAVFAPLTMRAYAARR
jgi:ABC-2 type transport system permease protein